MKLYNMYLSNFASKCRIAINEKGAKIEIVPIPGGDLKSPEYLKIYPMGKTPSLETSGQILGESEVINEYLEEKFPQRALLPKDAEGRARVRSLRSCVCARLARAASRSAREVPAGDTGSLALAPRLRLRLPIGG